MEGGEMYVCSVVQEVIVNHMLIGGFNKSDKFISIDYKNSYKIFHKNGSICIQAKTGEKKYFKKGIIFFKEDYEQNFKKTECQQNLTFIVNNYKKIVIDAFNRVPVINGLVIFINKNNKLKYKNFNEVTSSSSENILKHFLIQIHHLDSDDDSDDDSDTESGSECEDKFEDKSECDDKVEDQSGSESEDKLEETEIVENKLLNFLVENDDKIITLCNDISNNNMDSALHLLQLYSENTDIICEETKKYIKFFIDFAMKDIKIKRDIQNFMVDLLKTQTIHKLLQYLIKSKKRKTNVNRSYLQIILTRMLESEYFNILKLIKNLLDNLGLGVFSSRLDIPYVSILKYFK